jgi:hypothetical protein
LLTKGPLKSPKNVQIEFIVPVTHAGPAGDRIAVTPNPSFAARPSGLGIHVDWGRVGEIQNVAAAGQSNPVPLQDVDSAEEAQQWLEQKMRAWSGRA